MVPPQDNLLRRLLATFKPEAREHIDAIAAGLLDLERASDPHAQAAVLDTIFRAAHSLKGAARTVNLRDIEVLCQSLENVFAALRRKDATFTPTLFDLLHRVVAMLGTALQFADEPAATPRPGIADLVHALQSAASRHGQASIQPASTQSAVSSVVARAAEPTNVTLFADTPGAVMPASRRHTSETVRVATDKLDAVLLQAEELLGAKLAATQQAVRLRQCRAEPVEWKRRWMKLRTDMRSIRHALDSAGTTHGSWLRMMEFMDWSRGCIESLDNRLVDMVKVADHDQRSVSAMVDALLDEMKKVVMQPFSTMLEVLPRTVRELSREQGKLVELNVTGEEIEIDRRILEAMKDPLIHLMRNCIDHGVEMPQLRADAGKARVGTLRISIAAHDGGNVVLTIADDGRGIDVAAVRAAAVKLELLPAEQAAALSDDEALLLIFQSGVSTNPMITDISGRGLGLAIVKEKVEKLHGCVSVASAIGKGTTFRIVLPLTLARFRGVLIRAARRLFVMPTSSVERVLRIRTAEITTVENRETIVLNGQVIALARLADVLELPATPDAELTPVHQPAVVLVRDNQRIAFLVDEVINEQEVLVKRLGRQLVRVRNIAGATVLGNGQVVPILGVADLLESAIHSSSSGNTRAAPAAALNDTKQSVLVAEDSITSRMLLKNILETAGYRVETAVDGVDALEKLRRGAFDLVVSDVEMPRMDGFGLTTQLRADRKFNQTPVILVTALDSRQDRERGVDAGANAYIVKSSFDQSNLLEVVRRLI